MERGEQLTIEQETAQYRLRPELEQLPARLARLPIDERGYPVPWFVAWQNGKPEFRAMDQEKFVRAIQEKRCWVCGDVLGAFLTFVAGPMCGINRTSAEPPCHLECAEWSARNCPFLTRPHMVRREDDVINTQRLHEQSDGTALARNPGVALLWTTKRYTLFDGGAKPLIRMGEPTAVRFLCEGRPATRAEVVASIAIRAGRPDSDLAVEQDRREGIGAVQMLGRMKTSFERFLPADTAERAR